MTMRDFLRGTIRKIGRGRGRDSGQGSRGENRPRPATVATPAAGLDPAETDRFWSNVDRTGGPDACWPWLGPVNHKGYGRFRIKRDGRWTEVRAHRYAYEAVKGRLPRNAFPDHDCHTRDLECPGGVCRHRLCCNPQHLARTTNEQNLARARRRRERQRRLTQQRARERR